MQVGLGNLSAALTAYQVSLAIADRSGWRQTPDLRVGATCWCRTTRLVTCRLSWATAPQR